MKWICTICGYVYEGPEAPAKCPKCGVPADKFKKVEEEQSNSFKEVTTNEMDMHSMRIYL